MNFQEQYGPWALVAGASEGVGRAFAEVLASRGLNVVLLARRRNVLEDVAREIERQHGVRTRVVALDLGTTNAAELVIDAVRDLDIGFFVYCAGADPNYRTFLSSPIHVAESMVHRNCTVPMQLCHRLCHPMVERRRGAVVIFGSGAGFSGSANMVAYSASKAFDMVFAEALWCELRRSGVDVLGLILGTTDTPALRRLLFERGLSRSPDDPVKGAENPRDVVEDALAHLGRGPIRIANRVARWGLRFIFPFPRNVLVPLMSRASEKVMGKDAA